MDTPTPAFPPTEKTVELLLDAPLQLRLENHPPQLVVQALTVENGTNAPVTINVRFSPAAGGQLLALLEQAQQRGLLGVEAVEAPTLQ